MEALRAGVHVLCEKPWATNAADMRACCDVANETGLVLAAAAPWRWVEGRELFEMVFDAGLIGAIKGYRWQHGAAFDWPSSSNFYFSKAKAGGGVLIDEGIHFIDFLLTLFGPAKHVRYLDDNWGSGIEANASLIMEHEGRYGNVTGELCLSRTHRLENQFEVQCTEATIELDSRDPSVITICREIDGKPLEETLRLPQTRRDGRRNPFSLQLADFVASIRERRAPAVGGQDVVKTMELIDYCYAHAERIEEIWADVADSLPGLSR
jgi:predicted dehydrogenase